MVPLLVSSNKLVLTVMIERLRDSTVLDCLNTQCIKEQEFHYPIMLKVNTIKLRAVENLLR